MFQSNRHTTHDKPTQRSSRILSGKVKEPKGKDTTASIVVDKLISWGVKVIFGLVGDGVNPLIEALRERKKDIDFITVRHEEAAAFMASGYAKLTGGLGACIATSGPGAIHLLNGLYDASRDGAPVIAITGMTYSDLIGTHYMQEVDTVALFKDVASYNVRVEGARHALGVVDIACRSALSTGSVAHLTFPIDVQTQKFSKDESSDAAELLRGSSSWVPPIEVPLLDHIRDAADILNDGERVMILAGRGALHARAQVEQVAELLGAPVAQALLGRTVLPDNSPYTTEAIGHLGTLPSKELMQECDTLLILGSTMPYLEFYPKPGKARCVQIDHDPKRLGLRYQTEVGLTGDVKETLKLLIPMLKPNLKREFLNRAQAKMEKWRMATSKRESETCVPMKAEFVMATLRKYLHEDAIISLDCGNNTAFAARHLKLNSGQRICVSGTLATMAPGLPYAIAAKIAYPECQSVAVVGDGGLTMLMGELSTAAQYQIPIKVVVLKNNSLGMVRKEQAQIGNKSYGVELETMNFAKIAQACGVGAVTCSTPEELNLALQTTMNSQAPSLIEVEIDGSEEVPEPDEV